MDSNHLWVFQKTEVFITFKWTRTWMKYVRIFYEYILLEILHSFESKHLYKATIIVIYYFLTITIINRSN